MKEARYFYVPDAANQTELPQDEAVHALRVLRLKEGDEIFLQDGEGMFFRAVVSMTSSKHCFYEIVDAMPQPKLWGRRVHLAIAPTKNIDRMEWLAEKATEVGIDELSFLDCQFSERRQLRDDRIGKIVVAAMKQSRKAWLPKVNAMVPFRKFIEQSRSGRKFIAHCYEEIERKDFFEILLEWKRSSFVSVPLEMPSESDCTILIGPEGDFSVEEVRVAQKEGYESVSLGASRLRTETAGLTSVILARVCLSL